MASRAGQRARRAIQLGVLALLIVNIGSSTGFAVEFFNDLWQFSVAGTAFQEIDPVDPPPPRKSHRAIGNGAMSVFFGKTDQGKTADIHQYDPSTETWTEISFNRPSDFKPRGAHTVVRRDNDNVLVFGGEDGDGNALGDLWEVKLETGSFKKKAAFPGEPRFGHCAVMVEGLMYVFGGFGNGFLNDIWTYDPTTDEWSEVSPVGSPSPPARVFAAWAVARLAQEALGFFAMGGLAPAPGEQGLQPLDDVWAFNFDTMEWEQKADMPIPLQSSAAVKLPANSNGTGLNGVRAAQLPSNAVLLFGGRDPSGQPTDATLLYDVDTDTWQTLNPETTPPPRFAHTLVNVNGEVLLFGGEAEAASETAAAFRVARESGDVFADGSLNPGGANVAERVDVTTPVTAGNVIKERPGTSRTVPQDVNGSTPSGYPLQRYRTGPHTARSARKTQSTSGPGPGDGRVTARPLSCSAKGLGRF